jgi:hypothetical protein
MLLQRFATDAVSGPALCEIDVAACGDLYDVFVVALQEANAERSTSSLMDLIEAKLVGVCPKCGTQTPGRALAFVASARIFERVVSVGKTGGGERLAEGRCRNDLCTGTTILVFWRADESIELSRRMEALGASPLSANTDLSIDGGPPIRIIYISGTHDGTPDALAAERRVVEELLKRYSLRVDSTTKIQSLSGGPLPERSPGGLEAFVRVLQVRFNTGFLGFTTEFIHAGDYEFLCILMVE